MKCHFCNQEAELTKGRYQAIGHYTCIACNGVQIRMYDGKSRTAWMSFYHNYIKYNIEWKIDTAPPSIKIFAAPNSNTDLYLEKTIFGICLEITPLNVQEKLSLLLTFM